MLPSYAWPNWVLGNHDKSRIATRIGPAQARVAAMLLLTLRGTPTMYYGDEIGMQDVPIPPEQVKDPFEKNVPGLGLGRDPERTPMQWSAEERADFTSAEPWLPIAEDYRSVNVTAERDNPASLLTLYRRLIQMRRAEPALAVGDFAPVPADGDLMAYVRKADRRRLLIVLNLGPQPQSFNMSDLECRASLLLSTQLDRAREELGDRLELRPDEGVVIELR
jgi:alpha-glucosidase